MTKAPFRIAKLMNLFSHNKTRSKQIMVKSRGNNILGWLHSSELESGARFCLLVLLLEGQRLKKRFFSEAHPYHALSRSVLHLNLYTMTWRTFFAQMVSLLIPSLLLAFWMVNLLWFSKFTFILLMPLEVFRMCVEFHLQVPRLWFFSSFPRGRPHSFSVIPQTESSQNWQMFPWVLI